MTIKNPQGVGRSLVRVKSVQLPGKTEIKEVPVEVIKEVIKEVPVSNITAEKRAHEAESKLAEALATIERMKRPEPAIEQNGKEEPPEAIADLFQADRPFAEQALALQRLWVKLGHQVQRGEASPEERHKHERLSSEIEFINKHAFEGV